MKHVGHRASGLLLGARTRNKATDVVHTEDKEWYNTQDEQQNNELKVRRARE
jgi:hypothetical protein